MHKGNEINAILSTCLTMSPFQSVEYDPLTGSITKISEWLIPISQVEKLAEILAKRKDGQRVEVKRFDTNFKVKFYERVEVEP